MRKLKLGEYKDGCWPLFAGNYRIGSIAKIYFNDKLVSLLTVRIGVGKYARGYEWAKGMEISVSDLELTAQPDSISNFMDATAAKLVEDLNLRIADRRKKSEEQ